jgi:dethiobiotin synthetase
MKTRGLFLTGTDTGVGKTLVTAALLRQFRATGIDAVPMKPVQTGADRMADGWRAPDLEFVLEAIRYAPEPEERRLMAPYLYEHACSPHLAAELGPRLEYVGSGASAAHPMNEWSAQRPTTTNDERQEGPPLKGVPASSRVGDVLPTTSADATVIDHVKSATNQLLQRHDFIIAEGAGGVLVPLTRTLSTLDLMAALGWPVVIVARLGLGTINHSLLTIKAVREAGLEVKGIVFNAVEPHGEAYIEEDNPKTVCELADVPLLGVLPHFDTVQPTNAALWAQITLNFGLR